MTSQSARIEIAREIHDGIAQDLVALGYQLDVVLAAPEAPVLFRHEIRTIRLAVSELIEKVRAELFNLRTSIGFRESIEKVIAGMNFHIEAKGLDVDLTEAQSATLLKVIPELLGNAVKHSGASQICLEIARINTHLVVTIADDGKGGATLETDRFGLQGCLERIEGMDGSMTIDTGEAGTTITIAL